MNIPQYMQNNERVGLCNKKKLPYVIPREQLIKILRVTKDVKLAMIIFIGIFQGLRIGEIIRLKWSEVDLKYGELKVLDGKNTRRYKSNYGKDRIVPINEMFIPIFKKWKAMNPDQEFVIPTFNRNNLNNPKTHIKTYQDKFKECVDRAGLLEVDYYQKNGRPRYKYHTHSLRHVCGTNLYRAGMDIYQVKKFLGHEKIETTEIYCELARDDLRKASHKAYAYPKGAVALPEQPQIEVKMDKESLKLQKEVLERQLELTRLRVQPMVVHY